MKIIFLFSLLLTSFCSLSSGWSTSNGTGRITYVNAESNIVRIRLDATDLKNPDNCGKTDVVMLKGDSKNEERQYALIMAAFMANKPVKVYLNGCEPGWGTTFPRLSAIYVLE